MGATTLKKKKEFDLSTMPALCRNAIVQNVRLLKERYDWSVLMLVRIVDSDKKLLGYVTVHEKKFTDALNKFPGGKRSEKRKHNNDGDYSPVDTAYGELLEETKLACINPEQQDSYRFVYARLYHNESAKAVPGYHLKFLCVVDVSSATIENIFGTSTSIDHGNEIATVHTPNEFKRLIYRGQFLDSHREMLFCAEDKLREIGLWPL